MSGAARTIAVALVLALAGQGLAVAQQTERETRPRHDAKAHERDAKDSKDAKEAKKTPTPPAAPPAATPAPPPDTRAYDPQLLRLSEILGALTYLRGVCGAGDADQWRARMQALLEAEGKPDARRDRLAGAFNHGMQGYALSYRSCTQNARFVIQRFLTEGAGLARGLENRYRPG